MILLKILPTKSLEIGSKSYIYIILDILCHHEAVQSKKASSSWYPNKFKVMDKSIACDQISACDTAQSPVVLPLPSAWRAAQSFWPCPSLSNWLSPHAQIGSLSWANFTRHKANGWIGQDGCTSPFASVSVASFAWRQKCYFQTGRRSRDFSRH